MSAVVVVSHRTTSAQQHALDDACARAGVSCVRWHRGDAPLSDSALVVAGLGVGERLIPGEVIALVDAVGDNATLLLLTNEALVRPSVTLQRGRVVVVGGPQRADRLYGYVRMFASAPPGELENVCPWSWSAEVSPSMPVSSVDERGLTAVIPLHDGVEIEASLRASAADCMTGGEGESDEVRLHEVLGSRAGLVHLSAHAKAWFVYWPPVHVGVLRLYSASRLPSLYDLRSAASIAHPRLLRLGAQSGDTLLALSGARSWGEEAMARAMTEGGPGLLSRFREYERADWGTDAKAGGLVVEVR